MSDALRVERHGPVRLLIFALPERRNAMTDELTAAWGYEIAALRADPEVRCVVVTGEGSAFCAGGDLAWLGDARGEPADFFRRRMSEFYRQWLSIRQLPVPTIAAINGAAVGAGLCVALACDLRYATPGAALSMPFAALGLHPGMAATGLLPEVASTPVTFDLLLTGRSVRGQEALQLGLINEVADDPVAKALEVARTITQQAPLAIRLITSALRRRGDVQVDEALHWEALAQPVTMTTSDLHEGLAAARARRSPSFQDH